MRDIFENVACVGFTVGFAVGFAVTASALVGVLVTLGTHFCVHAATCAPLTFTADLDAFPMVMIDSVCTRDTRVAFAMFCIRPMADAHLLGVLVPPSKNAIVFTRTFQFRIPVKMRMFTTRELTAHGAQKTT